MNGRATVYDVAQLAGVSIKTVSRVVNGSSAVTDRTRKRVQDAVRSLRYVPNSHALSLRSGRSQTVGVVVDSLADAFFAAIVAIVERSLVTMGYTVLVAATGRQADREREQVQALLRHRIAGLVLAPTPSDHGYLTEALHGIPLVMVDRDGGVPGCDVVRVDDVGASRDAVAGLLANGHRRIAFIGDSTGIPTTLDRLRGYRQAHADAGVEVDSSLERSEPDESPQAEQLTHRLLTRRTPPTAFFCAHPRGTAGVIRALHAAGRTDRAVISFGDVQLGDLLSPALTVIDHRPELIAEAAADLLLRRLDAADPVQTDDTGSAGAPTRPPAPADIVVPLSLIRRGSGELLP